MVTKTELTANKKKYEADLKEHVYCMYVVDPVFGAPIRIIYGGMPYQLDKRPEAMHYRIPVSQIKTRKLSPSIMADIEATAIKRTWGKSIDKLGYVIDRSSGGFQNWRDVLVLEYLQKEWKKTHNVR